MPTFEEIAALVREKTGYTGPLTAETTLWGDLGVCGIDMDDLMTAYAEQFGVDLSGYLWYFHNEEEGINVGGLLFPPPNRRVKEIPITLGMLHEFATGGRWSLVYPPHRLPRFRVDTLINQLLVVSCVVACASGFITWLIR
jgi:hypothetical protein